MIDYYDEQETNLYETEEWNEDTEDDFCEICGTKLEEVVETIEYQGRRERVRYSYCPNPH